MKNANKTTIIFFIVILLFSIFILVNIIHRQKSANPIETMKKFLRGTTVTQEKPLKIKMRLANLDELNQSSIYDKFKGLKITDKPKEYPASISGQLSKRKIVLAYLPVYPKWAKNKRQKKEVILRFHVLPHGRVKNNISIIKSSGYEDVDTLAIEVLKKWTFYPSDKPVEQSGQISFMFNL